MNMFFKICASAGLIGISSSTFADNKFNNDLIQMIECKSNLSQFYKFSENYDKKLNHNKWKTKKGTNLFKYNFISQKPLIVHGMETNEISVAGSGIYAVYKNQDTLTLARKFQITQSPFFKDKPYFSGEKVVSIEHKNAPLNRAYLKLTLFEMLSENQESYETYLGCQYISELEKIQSDQGQESWGE